MIFAPVCFPEGEGLGVVSPTPGGELRGVVSPTSLSLSPPTYRHGRGHYSITPTQVRGGGGLPSPFGGKDFVLDSMD